MYLSKPLSNVARRCGSPGDFAELPIPNALSTGNHWGDFEMLRYKWMSRCNI